MAERGATPRQNLEVRVIAKAMKDEAFRQALVASKEVLNRELGEIIGGVRLPDNIGMKVLEETPPNLYIVLPPRPEAEGRGELSDAELAGVTGGAVTSICTAGPDNNNTLNASPCP
jgi:hypothetical protein